MQNRIEIHSSHVHNNKLSLVVSEEIAGLIPREHMLCDSDHFSFIYLMENGDEYTYIVIPEQIWPALKDALDQKQVVLLTSNEEQIELVNFKEELAYIVSNIKGNGNYGEGMVEKVENLF